MKQSILTLLFIFLSIVCANAQTESINQYESALESPLYAEASISGDDTQQDSSPIVQTERVPFDYKKTAEWGKYKALRAVGWTFLGVGSVSLVGGLFELALEQALSGKHSLAGPIMMISGGAFCVASIPILITAYNNRNKAKRMSLEVGMSQITSPTFAMNNLNVAPALSFKLTI